MQRFTTVWNFILLDIFGIAPNSLRILLTHREARNTKVLRDVPDYERAKTGIREERECERQVHKYCGAFGCRLDNR